MKIYQLVFRTTGAVKYEFKTREAAEMWQDHLGNSKYSSPDVFKIVEVER